MKPKIKLKTPAQIKAYKQGEIESIQKILSNNLILYNKHHSYGSGYKVAIDPEDSNHIQNILHKLCL